MSDPCSPHAATVGDEAIGLDAHDIAQALGATADGPATIRVTRIVPSDAVRSGCLTFIRDARRLDAWARDPHAGGSVALVDHASAHARPEARELARKDRVAIVVPDADLALSAVSALLFPDPPAPPPGIHPAAFVDPTARIDPTAIIGPGCVVGPHATIDAHARLDASVTVGHSARIGSHTRLHPGVRVLDRCIVGKRCIIHGNAVLGGDGFGYRPAPGGKGLVKLHHAGIVHVHDDVEIGAGTTIDRAKFGATVIGSGTKIDNLCQIGHNCTLGRCCILCGMVGLSGSVILGDGVVLGGKVGVADNVTIGSNSKVAAYGGVINDIPPNSTYLGQPAGPADEMLRSYVALRKLGRRKKS